MCTTAKVQARDLSSNATCFICASTRAGKEHFKTFQMPPRWLRGKAPTYWSPFGRFQSRLHVKRTLVQMNPLLGCARYHLKTLIALKCSFLPQNWPQLSNVAHCDNEMVCSAIFAHWVAMPLVYNASTPWPVTTEGSEIPPLHLGKPLRIACVRFKTCALEVWQRPFCIPPRQIYRLCCISTYKWARMSCLARVMQLQAELGSLVVGQIVVTCDET